MAGGIGGIREAVADIEARKAAGASGGAWVQWLKLKPGESATIRFLEQGDDVNWCWMHQLPPRGDQKYGDNEPCLNTRNDGTPCPGCERGLRRIVNGFVNVIWRDGPVWASEEVDSGKGDGKKWKKLKKSPSGDLILDHREDILAVWKGGITVFEELDGIDVTYKGLMSRDFKVTRRGEGLNTKYSIVPADPDGGPQPMSEKDKELYGKKPDLTPYVTPAPYDEWGQGNQRQASTDSGGVSQEEAGSINPFMRS